jgi:hypothetical protein
MDAGRRGRSVITSRHLDGIQTALNMILDDVPTQPSQHTAESAGRIERFLIRSRDTKIVQPDRHARLAGQAALIRADALREMGNLDAARRSVVNVFTLGREAGLDDLCAGALHVETAIEFYTGDPEKCVNVAATAQDYAGGQLAVRLELERARGLARMGKAQSVLKSVMAAHELYDSLPSEQTDKFFRWFDSIHVAEINYHAAVSLAIVGLSQIAEMHAGLAQADLEVLGMDSYRAALNFNIATMWATLGYMDIERSLALVDEGLDLIANRRSATDDIRLNRYLLVLDHYRTYPGVREIRDKIHDWRELPLGA